ncbi:MAG: NAD(P)/FAD-dependent oxidoreductase [Desulfitobacteriaceae bacterium]
MIVGNGPAGSSAIERIRQLDREGNIILISAEHTPPYSRIMTPEYMVDEVKEEQLYYRGTDFYSRNQVDCQLGQKVSRILSQESQVELGNGERIAYDRLLVATGSRPLVPGWIDPGLAGVFTLWNKTDSEAINKYLNNVKQAVIIGGGLVGLQAAQALTAYGIRVTVVEMASRLMSAQLDATAGEILRQALEAGGVNVYTNTKVKALHSAGQKVVAVETEAGQVEAELVLVAVGVKPNLEFVDGTGLALEKGLLTDRYLETSIPGIYAAGDVAQAPVKGGDERALRALWLNAVQQGKIAGANMAGAREVYPGSVAMNSTELFGLKIVSLGQIEGEGGMEEVILKFPASGAYQKLFFKEQKLAGLIFSGDIQQAGVLFHKLGESLNQGYWGFHTRL